MIGFRLKSFVESGLLQVNNPNGGLQKKNDGSFSRTTVVSFRWRGYRRITTVVGFKWRTLVVSGLLQVNNYSRWLKIVGFARKTTEVSFNWGTAATAIDGEQQW